MISINNEMSENFLGAGIKNTGRSIDGKGDHDATNQMRRIQLMRIGQVIEELKDAGYLRCFPVEEDDGLMPYVEHTQKPNDYGVNNPTSRIEGAVSSR